MSTADRSEHTALSPGHTGARWPSTLRTRIKSTVHTVYNHTLRHTGVGIVCAVAYFDPGNWGVDLQAGSEFGYKLLFIVLLSGIFAVFLQILASRLGCVTGLDLASHCRLLLHDRPKHTLLYRWLLLYPLYILSEAAIIATDLAELIGSGIALCLLFPKLPLWAGVLITASDVLVFLAIKDPLGGQPVRLFELIIAGMVFTVLICMAIIISQVGVKWGDAFHGFVPSSTVFKSGALYISVGIIGATVMPHSIFLGSALATQDRISARPKKLARVHTNSTTSSSSSWSVDSDGALADGRSWRARTWRRFKTEFREMFQILPVDAYATDAKNHAEHENHSYAFVHAHVYHGMIDIAVSLLGIAVVVNSLILILAGAVFYYGAGAGSGGPASLFDAYDLLRDIVGQGAATLFALALLAAGQSSSIIATMAGQRVSEGFLRWRISPVMRRLVTRGLGLVPSMAVAIAAGRSGIDTLLVASQVALSIVLPFIVFPLLLLTGSKVVMAVKRPQKRPVVSDGDGEGDDNEEDEDDSGDKKSKGDAHAEYAGSGAASIPDLGLRSSGEESVAHPEGVARGEGAPGAGVDLESAREDETESFANGRVVSVLGWLLWLIVAAANVYAIVSLGLGQT